MSVAQAAVSCDAFAITNFSSFNIHCEALLFNYVYNNFINSRSILIIFGKQLL